jgi:NAD(P)-dependent dehydrogenase (short-subunit alcohol dehydrogenase family)
MDLGLTGKVAAVTGGGRGIGRATVLALAREGVQVAYCARSPEQLQVVEKEVANEGGVCLPLQLDLAEPGAADEFIGQTVDHFGDIDILVANHGIHQIKDFEDLTDDDWYKTFEINFFGAMRVCRAAIPHMKRKQKGHIVVISAGSINKPSIGVDEHPHYTASKAAIASFAKFLSKRYGPDNILVNCVLPGYAISPAILELWKTQAEQEGISSRDHFVRLATEIGNVPVLHRAGTTEEFANVITFLVSGACTYMSGVNIQIDGGALDVP